MKANHPLLKLAQGQAGLFTSQQAVESGIDSRNHSYHLKGGNWSRLGRGIYRLNFVSENSKQDFFFFQLWSKNHTGQQAGVFSYETALFLMGLDIAKPLNFHITVPLNFYKKAYPQKKLILHYEDLKNVETIKQNNLYITNVSKTFQDLISSGSYSSEWIKKHLKAAMDKKLISLEDIKKISVQEKMKRTFSAILFELV